MFRLEKEMQTPVTRGLQERHVIDTLSATLAPRKKAQGVALELKHARCTLAGCKTHHGPACLASVTIDHRMLKQAQALMRSADYYPPNSYNIASRRFKPLAFKIPDDSQGEKPFDCFTLHGIPAGFLLGFSCPRAGFRAYLVTLDTFTALVSKGKKAVTPADCTADVTYLFDWS